MRGDPNMALHLSTARKQESIDIRGGMYQSLLDYYLEAWTAFWGQRFRCSYSSPDRDENDERQNKARRSTDPALAARTETGSPQEEGVSGATSPGSQRPKARRPPRASRRARTKE